MPPRTAGLTSFYKNQIKFIDKANAKLIERIGKLQIDQQLLLQQKNEAEKWLAENAPAKLEMVTSAETEDVA